MSLLGAVVLVALMWASRASAEPRGADHPRTVIRRMEALVARHKGISKTTIAELAEKDPVLSAHRARWTRRMVDHVLSLGSAPREVRKNKYTPEVLTRVGEIRAAHPSATAAQLAKLFASDELLADQSVIWSKSTVHSVVERFRAQLPPRPKPVRAPPPPRGPPPQVADEAVAGRVRALYLGMSTLTMEQLARELARDPVTRHQTWNAARVDRVLAQTGTTSAHRDRALAERVRAAVDAGEPAGLPELVERIAAAHPGFNEAILWRLAGDHPAVARALDRHLGHHPPVVTSPETPPPLGLAQARALYREADVGAKSMALVLAGSPALPRWMKPIRDAETVDGNGDGVLARKDLANASPATLALMRRVYALVGGERRLALSEVKGHLPDAISLLFRDEPERPELQALYAEAAVEGLHELSRRYVDEYVRDARDQTTFRSTWALGPTSVTTLQARLPAFYPDRKAVPIDRVAALYRRVLAGEVHPHSYFRWTGVDAVTTRLLQLLDPQRFPRPPFERKHHAVFPGLLNLSERSEEELDRLSAQWKGEVLTGRMTVFAFRKANGLSSRSLHELYLDADRFPRVKDVKGKGGDSLARTAQVVAERMKAMRAEDILIPVPDMLARLNGEPDFLRDHRRVSPPRYQSFRSRYGRDAYPSFRADPELIIATLAAEVRAFREAHPEAARDAIQASLKAKHPRMRQSHWYRLGRAHPELVRDAPKPADLRAQPLGNIRQSLPIRRLFQLLVELSPPGTSLLELTASLNRLLAARGLEPYADRSIPYDYYRRVKGSGDFLRLERERVTAAILAEYAAAAPPRTPDEQVYAAVKRDYPRLSTPSLRQAAAAAGGLGRLVAKLKPGKTPRYRGGWDVERAVLSDPERREALMTASQFARIQMRLPLLEEALEKYASDKPLDNVNVLRVSHGLATEFALDHALNRAGALKHRTIKVFTPYGANPAVTAAVRDLGYDVRVPELSMKSYLDEVQRAVDDMVALHRKNLLPIVVLDDGGLVATILHSDPKYKDVLHAVKVVEQTTGGLNLLEKKTLAVPVIAAAAALSKKREGPIIGRAVAGKVLQALRRHGRSLEGLKVAVIGYGNVGTATARELELALAEVAVVDDGKGAARRAGKRFPVLEKAEALKWADVVISATGETSLQLEHLRLLKDGAVVISAGSKQLEFDMERLLANAKRRVLARGNPLVRLPDVEYTLDGRRLTFLGDGWPVNFDGDAEDIPPHEIQLTRTLMFLGAVQAARLNAYRAAPGVQPFDKDMDRWLLKRFAELRKRAPKEPIGDPDRWADVIRGVARVAGIE